MQGRATRGFGQKDKGVLMVRLAVVGATGLVGAKMLQVLSERDFPVQKLIPVASKKSEGEKIRFKEKTFPVIALENLDFSDIDLALFSAGGSVSRKWAPQFANAGITVIDNSSAWRMEPDVPLVVPEINSNILSPTHKIIANPNCSTIQMVLALYPLHRVYGLQKIIVSTYQSVTGSGYKGVNQLKAEQTNRQPEQPAYPHTINGNCLPHIDDFQDNGFTREEMKMIEETQKILSLPHLHVSPTTVRVPVLGGHSESVYAEFTTPPIIEDARKILEDTPGVMVQDNPQKFEYPMPLSAMDTDDVYVGRIRKDPANPNALLMWIVADNLRKGAATNAVQIAEYLMNHKLLG